MKKVEYLPGFTASLTTPPQAPESEDPLKQSFGAALKSLCDGIDPHKDLSGTVGMFEKYLGALSTADRKKLCNYSSSIVFGSKSLGAVFSQLTEALQINADDVCTGLFYDVKVEVVGVLAANPELFNIYPSAPSAPEKSTKEMKSPS